MSTRHMLLAQTGRSVCRHGDTSGNLVTSLSLVTCRLCHKSYRRVLADAEEAAAERRQEARVEAAVEQTGLHDLWAFVQDLPDGATPRLLRGIIGSVIAGLAEMGYRP